MKMFTGDEPLDNGSILHWGERDPSNPMRGYVTCGSCVKKGRSADQAKRLTTYPCGKRRKNATAGYCPDCRGVKKHKRERNDPLGVILPSKTIILMTETGQWKRDPDNRLNQMILCHGCNKEKSVWRSTIHSKNWSGLCSDCIRLRGNPRKSTEVIKVPGGTIEMESDKRVIAKLRSPAIRASRKVASRDIAK